MNQPAPQHLSARAKVEWAVCAQDLTERGLLVPAVLGQLEAYCSLVGLIARYTAAVERDGPTVRTKTGEPKPHGLIGSIHKASEVAARIAGDLRLTPAARLRERPRQPTTEELGGPPGLDV